MLTLRKLIAVRIYLFSCIEALLIVLCYTAALFILRPFDAPMYLEYDGGALRIGAIAAVSLVTSYLFDFYRQPYSSRLLSGLQLSHFIGILLLAQAAMAFISRDFVLPQDVSYLGGSFMLVVLIGWRMFVRPMFWSAFGAQKVLFVGAGPSVRELARAFEAQSVHGMEVIGFMGDNSDPTAGPFLGTPEQLSDVVAAVSPDRIIVDTSVEYKHILLTLMDLRAAGMSVETAAQAYESTFSRIDVRSLQPYVTVFLEDLEAPAASLALQSIYNNLLGLAATVIALPFLLVIAVALRVFRSGPVFAKLPCIGLHGIPFTLYRFRYTAQDGGFLDRVLIRTRLVSLPQVVNLYRGELAVIGPRPERAEFNQELNRMIPFYRQKQSVKPGVFGWSQLHCDSQEDEDTLRRLEYDLYYIKHISVHVDLYIMLQAIKRVLAGERHLEKRGTAVMTSGANVR